MSRDKKGMFEPGTVLDDKWIIMELVGKGAMGEVYRAHQTNLKRDVAIKVIADEVLAELEDDPEELETAFGRFQREVQTMARVRHPNILNIYDYGETGDAGRYGRTAYIVMEFIPGDSLRFTMSEDGLDDNPDAYAQWIERCFMPILDGVELLHANGIVHRDLKPENIFMDGDIPKIADFGLARSRHMKAVTTSLEMLGTLAYMAPEQGIDFRTAGFAADIYSLGKILYEAFSGTLTEKTLPFTAVTLENRQTNFLAEVSEIIGRATAVSPADRYRTIAELRADLIDALSSQPVGQRPKREEHSAAPKKTTISGGPLRNLVLGCAVVIVVMTIAGAYYFGRNLQSAGDLDDRSYSGHEALDSNEQPFVADSGDLPETIIGHDGSRMVLTGDPGGDPGSMLFYVDERAVTNFMFVEFLNSIRGDLSVTDGVVRKDNTIISYIGGGPPGEEAIIYEHDTFHLNDQAMGDRPVVRVTFHGAHLYASAYGKELLTRQEWQFAYRYHAAADGTSTSGGPQQGDEGEQGHVMMHAEPDEDPRQNETGALADMGRTIREWVNISPAAAGAGEPGDEPSYTAGVIDAATLDGSGSPHRRSPWEGFDDVGFRTKVAIVKQ